MNLNELTDAARNVKTLADRLRISLERLHNVDRDAEAELATLLADPVFKRHSSQHHKVVLADLKAERLRQRKPAAGVALYAAESAVPTVERALRAFRQDAMRPPDEETAVLTRANQAGLSMTDTLLVRLVAAQTRANLFIETQEWQPSRWRDAYRAAIADPTDIANACFIRYTEDRHGAGWSGASPISDIEIAEAGNLRKLVAATQAARVPIEVDQIEQALADVKKTIGRAKDLHRIEPANPDHDPAARAAFESEAAELEQAS